MDDKYILELDDEMLVKLIRGITINYHARDLDLIIRSSSRMKNISEKHYHELLENYKIPEIVNLILRKY